ncbi:hypothetical protein LAW74_24305 [Escherichia coli]|nr:hypothetical protein [Escherichia coli]MDD8428158.1 hypothetical protein [Escherichia coli]MDD8437227.1 hypothetical protein [Escherichia coli]
MAIDTASDASALFEKIVKYGMRCQYVTPLLILSQHEFLSTLISGVERIYQRSITRKELAEVAGFSSAAIYSYTASPSARDSNNIGGCEDCCYLACVVRAGSFAGSREGIKPGEDISHIVKKTGRRKK